jgi:hypothetical protein
MRYVEMSLEAFWIDRLFAGPIEIREKEEAVGDLAGPR